MTFPRAWRRRLGGDAFGAVLALTVMLSAPSAAIEYFGAVLVLAFSAILLCREKLAPKLTPSLKALLGGLYVGFLIPFVVLLFRRPDGRAWIGWLFVVIMAGDSAAYFIGKRFGKRKVAPLLSPGKTVAGVWGYLVAAVVVGAAGALLLFNEYSWLEISLVALALGILGQVGDLFESWLKRLAAVKDAGSVLPGHGGLLDRLDSLIFPAVFATAYLRIFHS